MNRRFALIQALVSLVALAAVVWWASKQEAPHIPTRRGRDRLDRRRASGCTCSRRWSRAERWHWILASHGRRREARSTATRSRPSATWATTCSPRARARPSGWCCCRRAATRASAPCIGSIVAERVLDADRAARDLRGHGLRGASDRERAAHEAPAARRRRSASCSSWPAPSRSGCCASHHVFERVRDWLRPLADSPRALARAGASCCWPARSCCGRSRRSVYWTVARALEIDISIGGALYLVALTNFVAALPAAPGSIGTFDAAVACGACTGSARPARRRCPTCSCCASSSTSRSRSSAWWCWSPATAAGHGYGRPRTQARAKRSSCRSRSSRLRSLGRSSATAPRWS